MLRFERRNIMISIAISMQFPSISCRCHSISSPRGIDRELMRAAYGASCCFCAWPWGQQPSATDP